MVTFTIRIALSALVFVGVAGTALAGPANRNGPVPPAVYIDKGVCPFEGCTYRAWTAKADVRLFDGPGGAPTGAVVRKGEQVEALTGEVHVKPLKVTVRRGFTLGSRRIRPGDTYWLLTYLGEGYHRAWVDGEIVEVDSDFGWEGQGTCSESNTCMSEPDGGREGFLRWTREGAVWWVKMQTEAGKVGWTREAKQFDGKDVLGSTPPRPSTSRAA